MFSIKHGRVWRKAIMRLLFINLNILLIITLNIPLLQISPRYDRSLTALTDPRQVVGNIFFFLSCRNVFDELSTENFENKKPYWIIFVMRSTGLVVSFSVLNFPGVNLMLCSYQKCHDLIVKKKTTNVPCTVLITQKTSKQTLCSPCRFTLSVTDVSKRVRAQT